MADSLFGNKPEDKENSTAGIVKTETTVSPNPPTRPVNTESQPAYSVIGKNIEFRGELIGKENLHVEGAVEGTILMEGHDLSVGEHGAVNANIHASNIIINGKLTGDVLADELIAIKNTAVVKGSLIAPRIQLDDGGKFRGSMDMVDNDQEKKERKQAFQEKLVHPHLPARDATPDAKANPQSSGNKNSHQETKSKKS